MYSDDDYKEPLWQKDEELINKFNGNKRNQMRVKKKMEAKKNKKRAWAQRLTHSQTPAIGV